MHGNGDLICCSKHPRVRHLPRLHVRLLKSLRPPGQLLGQSESLSGSASLQPALGRSPQTIGEVIHRTGQRRRINHAASLRVAPGLLPTGEHSGTVT
jgi:hypothetical protein